MTDPQPLTDDNIDAGEWWQTNYPRTLTARLWRAARAARAERDELRIAIHGGCGCPAPYTECPHDEPLLPAVNDARRKLAAARAERDALRSAAEYPERTAGFLQGYYEGWADAKAGRQYGEGPYGQRSTRAALDSSNEADQWKTWPVTHAWGVRWYVGRAIDGEDVALFATFNRERDARLVAYALNAIGARALDGTSEADQP